MQTSLDQARAQEAGGVCYIVSNFVFGQASLVTQIVKNLPANARDSGDLDLIPG